MAQTKTGLLRFKAPTGETVERPQEEVQSLRRAGFTPEAGQSLLLRNAEGGVSQIPVERLSRVSPEVELSIPSQERAFQSVAEQRFGGVGGTLSGLAYGGLQGFSSGFGGGGLIEAGADPETLAMIKAAQPVATFAGEALGMAGQAALTGGLGTIGRGARAATAVAEAAPTLGRLAARGAAREAAAGALYGAGSEITEAKIEGREARPLEAAATTGAAGGVIGAAFPVVGRGFSTLKGAAKKLGVEKIAESETLRAAELAKAEQKLASAKTAEQRAAARDELKNLRDAAKAAEKKAEQGIKQDVAAKLDDAAIQAGEDAQTYLQAHREVVQGEVDARVAVVGDALEQINATDARLKEMGFTGAEKAQAKLTEEVQSLGNKINEIGADIKARSGIISQQETIGSTKESLVSAMSKAKDAKSLAARESAVARQNYANLKTAGARAEQIATAYDRLAMSELQEKLAAEHINALEEAGGALHTYNQIAAAGRSLGKDIGIIEGNIAKEVARSESLARDLERIVPDQLRHTSEAGESSLALAESVARKMGLAPAIADIIPSMGTRETAFGAGIGRIMTKESTEQILTSAARTGGEEFIDAMMKLGKTGMRKPKGLSIPRDIIGSNKADIVMWLSSEDGARALASLDETQRARVLKDVISDMDFGKKSAAAMAKKDVVRLLKKPGAAIPLAVPEGELQAALTRVQQATPSVTPEIAFSAEKMAKRASIEGEREASRVTQQGLSDVAEKLAQQKSLLDKDIAEAGKEMERLQGKAKVTAYERKMAPMGQAQESLLRKIDQQSQLRNQLTAAEESLLANAQKAPVDQAAITKAQQEVVNAVNLLQKAKLQREVDVLAAKKTGLEAEHATKQAQLKEILGGDGITGIAQIRRDAGAVVDAFRQYAGPIGKIEKSAITGKYYVPGEDKIIERAMQEYMRTPEGKKIAAAMAAASKAESSKAAREVEAEVRKAAGVPAEGAAPSVAQAAKDAFTDPAVIAATVMGGPASGLGVMAAMIASRSGKVGIRQMLTSMSPLFFYQSLERIAIMGEKMAMAPVAKTAAIIASNRMDQVSRKDVEKAKTDVDQILQDQEDAKNAFALTAKGTRFPVDQFSELEQQYNGAIGQLQKMRPKTAGSGAVSAEEEDFVRAFRLVTDPGALSRAFQQGTLTRPQAELLQKVSPQAYSSLEHIAKVVHDERPQSLSPRIRSALGITVSQSGGELSIGQAMKLMGQSEQAQQQNESLGTSRPPNSKNSSIAKNVSLAGQGE
jgi:predicted transcriptional regulator